MRRSHLTLGLIGLAALAALLQPKLATSDAEASATVGRETSSALEAPPAPVLSPIPAAEAQLGGLRLTATPDQTRWTAEGGDRYVIIELEANGDAPANSLPVHLSLVLDTSGSMYVDDRLEQAQEAASLIVSELGPDDQLALVGFDDEARTLRPLGRIRDRRRAMRLIDGLEAGGSTALFAGLTSGAKQLSEVPQEAIRRIVLLSDGAPTIGPRDTTSLAQAAAEMAQGGSSVSALGLGQGFDIDTMMAIADAGGGRYHYVEDPGSVAAMFQEELRQLRGTLARQVQVEIEGVEVVDVYGYESWDGEATPTGYRVFVGDVSSDHPRKIVARVRPRSSAPGPIDLARVSVSFTDPVGGKSHATEMVVRGEVVEDHRLAAASVQSEVGALLMRAWAGRAMEEAVATRGAGDAVAAREELTAAWTRLDEMERRYGVTVADEKAALLDLRRRYDAVEVGSREELSLEMMGRLQALGYVE